MYVYILHDIAHYMATWLIMIAITTSQSPLITSKNRGGGADCPPRALQIRHEGGQTAPRLYDDGDTDATDATGAMNCCGTAVELLSM